MPERISALLGRRPAIAPAVALGLLFVALLPARGTTMRGDDAGFHLGGLMKITHETILGMVGDSIVDGFERFRPQILASFQGILGILAFESRPTAYKVFLVALAVLCAGLLWVLLRRLGAPVAVAVMAVAIVGASIQFRAYHDPVLGYFGSTQTALACVLGSLIVFLTFLRTGARRPLVVSTLLFAAACLLHEYVYPLAAAHLVLALQDRRGRAALRAAAPALGVGALFTLIGFVGRMGVAPQEAFAGYELTNSVGGSLRSFFVQLLPPLPGAARIFDQGPSVFYPAGVNPTNAELFGATWRGLAVALAVGGAAYVMSRRLPEPRVIGRLAGLGVTLWTTPVMLLAVSPKYQAELTPGKGYLPVLFQSFGVALAFCAVILGLLRLAGARSRAAVLLTIASAALLLGYGAAVTGFNNLRIAALDNLYREGRDLIETGAQRGAFGGLEKGTTVLFSERDTTWSTGDWRLGEHTVEAALILHTDVLFDGRVNVEQTGFDCPDRRDRPVPADCEPINTTAAWVRARPRPGGGSVTVARLEGATTENFKHLTTTSLRSYHSSPDPPKLVGKTADGAPWTAPADGWKRVGGEGGWSLWELEIAGEPPVAYSLDDALAKVDYAALPGPEDRVRIYGVKRLLP